MTDLWRKRIRLMNYDYSSNNAYFLTICTENRICCLRDRETLEPTHYADVVKTAIENIETIYPGVTVDKYVIMPNHIHLILLLSGAEVDISTIIRLMKRHVTTTIGKPIWQKSFHDHIIRDEKEYLMIWEYIENNPVKWQIDRYYCTP